MGRGRTRRFLAPAEVKKENIFNHAACLLHDACPHSSFRQVYAIRIRSSPCGAGQVYITMLRTTELRHPLSSRRRGNRRGVAPLIGGGGPRGVQIILPALRHRKTTYEGGARPRWNAIEGTGRLEGGQKRRRSGTSSCGLNIG